MKRSFVLDIEQFQFAIISTCSEYTVSHASTQLSLNINSDNLNDQMQIICKATDSSYNTQPEKSVLSWNIRGLNNNSWHKVDYQLGNPSV